MFFTSCKIIFFIICCNLNCFFSLVQGVSMLSALAVETWNTVRSVWTLETLLGDQNVSLCVNLMLWTVYLIVLYCISGTTRKTRIIDVVYNASNNELIRTKTLVKNAIVVIDATPFRQWYENHYYLPLGRMKGAKLVRKRYILMYYIE